MLARQIGFALAEVKPFDTMKARHSQDFARTFNDNDAGLLRFSALLASQTTRRDEHRPVDAPGKAASQEFEPLRLRRCVVWLMKFHLDADTARFVLGVADTCTNEIEPSLVVFVTALIVPSIVRVSSAEQKQYPPLESGALSRIRRNLLLRACVNVDRNLRCGGR